MHIPRLLTFTAILMLSVLGAAASPVDPLNQPGSVLLLRHALAPGMGDPAEFRLGDCGTQRNLSAEGRAQAREIGEQLRAGGIDSARVYTSQWCRCVETAELLDVGPVTELPALNSFFRRAEDREPNIAALRAFLAEQPVSDTLIILVTHQVTVTALTDIFPASGTGVLLQLDGAGDFSIVDRVMF